MPDVTLAQSGTANGVATPATMTLTGATLGNLLVCCVYAAGTSPTVATPTGDAWVQAQKVTGASFTTAMYYLVNAAAGSHTPSSVLGGTITGWVILMFEFSACGANCGLQGSNNTSLGVAQLTNIFPTTGITLSNELFLYAVARTGTNTFTPQNSFISPLAVWSPSVQPFSGVQGISGDFFWASNLGQGVGQYPTASGLISTSAQSKNLAAWFNTIASQGLGAGEWIGGKSGITVPQHYRGMVGG